MENTTIVETKKPPKLINILAEKYQIDPKQFLETVKNICFAKGTASDEELAAFLVTANKYDLNPLLKEIHAFSKLGKMHIIVGIDGWTNIINRHPQFDGTEFHEIIENGKLVAITCAIHRKDRSHPTIITEYFSECYQKSSGDIKNMPWDKYPVRMLRHKALIQCARYAFGFSGIIDEDEAHRIGYDQSYISPPPTNIIEVPAETTKEGYWVTLQLFEDAVRQLDDQSFDGEIDQLMADFDIERIIAENPHVKSSVEKIIANKTKETN